MKEVSEQQNKDVEVSCNNDKSIESSSRRKAVKTLVGGVTALAAYNLLPAKWGTPVIEQIFLPAHAATSGVGTHKIWIEVDSYGYYDESDHAKGQKTSLSIIWEVSPVWDDNDSFTFSISSGGMTSTHSSFTGKVGEDGGLTINISKYYGVTPGFPTSGTYVLNVTYSGHQYTPTGPMTVTVPTI